MLAILLASTLTTNVINQPSPSTKIHCPVFMTRAQAVFGRRAKPPTPYSKILQRAICFRQVVKPLQDHCILAGYEEKKCKARTLAWIKAGRKKK